MWPWITARFAEVHSWVFETLVQPVMYQAGFMAWEELAFEGTELFLIGVIELALLWALFRPLEALAPVEKWDDRKASRIDFLYAALAKLGVLPFFFFVVLTPAFDWINSSLRMADVIPPNLEDFFTALKDAPLASACLYFVLFDLADYWRHRFEHRFGFWWALHAVHHSQRQMSFWTDDREHLLDLFIGAAVHAAIGLAIGVPPAQFLAVTIASAAVQSFSHANVRMHFGRIGRYLLVSPIYHRLHHAIGAGHEGRKFGCNFAAVLPIWDVLFRTANFDVSYHATGIRDQLEGRDYGSGFWSQQALGIRRMLGAA